jgi:hypothetical protein
MSEKYDQKVAMSKLHTEIDRLRRDNERLQKAHDHQYEMAGLMLREAERYGRELAEARGLLQRVARDVCDSFATRPEYPTLCDDIDAFLAAQEGDR